jgi:hypothetical protein
MHSGARFTHAIILAGVSQCIIASAFAASPSNAVIRWNANAGAAATKACAVRSRKHRVDLLVSHLAKSGSSIWLAIFDKIYLNSGVLQAPGRHAPPIKSSA